MSYSNLHTHTIYCDGKDTPEALVQRAISLGCDKIGFSGHSYTFFDESYCMSKENTQKYCNEILILKKKCKDKIEVLLGIEQDLYSKEPTDIYDYVIGSVHYIKTGEEYLDIDGSREGFIKLCREHFDGDYYALCREYYKELSKIYEVTNCDVVGHFDIVTKFNEGNCLFDETNPKYRESAVKCLDKLIKENCTFEINTGAMARGYRTAPYMSGFLEEYAREHNARLIYTSDCHDKKDLLYKIPCLH